jgi:hypothetical protein
MRKNAVVLWHFQARRSTSVAFLSTVGILVLQHTNGQRSVRREGFDRANFPEIGAGPDQADLDGDERMAMANVPMALRRVRVPTCVPYLSACMRVSVDVQDWFSLHTWEDLMNRMMGFLSRRDNWPIVVIPLILLAWGMYGAPTLGLKSFNSFSQYPGIYTDPLKAGPEGDPVADKVLLIIVDGLGVDASQQMTALNRMRSVGADRTLRTGVPSFSLPGWTVLTTGAWQEQSGFATNEVNRPVTIDSLFDAARRAGLRTAIAGPGGIDAETGQASSYDLLYAGKVDDLAGFAQPDNAYLDTEGSAQLDDEIAATALGQHAEFQLVHFLAVDDAGHGYGGASPEYAAAVQAVDAHIDRLLENADLDTTAVFVTADHGHIARGGHGGSEPEVVNVPLVSLGAGIAAGSYEPATQADVAPTIAALLGLSIPAHNQGWLLLDQIAAPMRTKAARAVDTATQLDARVASMLNAIGDSRTIDESNLDSGRAALEAGDYEAAMQLSSDFALTANDTWEAARSAHLARERWGRLAIAILLLVPLALYLLWWSRAGWPWKLPWLLAVVYTVAWNVNYLLIEGNSYEITMFNTESGILPFIQGRVMSSLILMTVLILVLAVIRRGRMATEVAREAVHTLLAIGLVLMAQILFFYVLWGVTYEWYIPDVTMAFKYYMDLFQTTAYWPLPPLPFAAIAPLLAVGIAWAARRIVGPGQDTQTEEPVAA